MTESKPSMESNWVDPDDAPPWTADQFARAEYRMGNRVIRPANGTLNKPGRPPEGDVAKRQVTLRLDPQVIDRFREGGPGWQSRINAALRKAVGL
jgi:uncharacterized protein (DUF4415 family)